MILIHNLKQGTKEWHKLRDGLYTGSNAHKLFKFGKIEYAKTEEKAFGGNFFTKRGHTLEDEAIEIYEHIKNIKVDRPGFITNSKYPECGYSPDGLLADRTIEVKCFGIERHKAVAKTQPIEIIAQIQFGAIICEKKQCDLLLYNPDIEAKDALIIISIKKNADIVRNFKRIMKA